MPFRMATLTGPPVYIGLRETLLDLVFGCHCEDIVCSQVGFEYANNVAPHTHAPPSSLRTTVSSASMKSCCFTSAASSESSICSERGVVACVNVWSNVGKYVDGGRL